MQTEDCFVCTVDSTAKFGWLTGTNVLRGHCKHRTPNCNEPKYETVPILFALSFTLFAPLLVYILYNVNILRTKTEFDLEFTEIFIEILNPFVCYVTFMGTVAGRNLVKDIMNGYCTIHHNSSYYGIKSFLPKRVKLFFRLAPFFIVAVMFVLIMVVIFFVVNSRKAVSPNVLILKIAMDSLCAVTIAILVSHLVMITNLNYLLFLIAFQHLETILNKRLYCKKYTFRNGLKLETRLIRIRKLYLATKKNYEVVNEALNPPLLIIWLLVTLILVVNFYYIVMSIKYSSSQDYFLVTKNLVIVFSVLVFNISIQNVSNVVRIFFLITYKITM